MNTDKKILDVTCGARTIWFDKNNPYALFCDKRRESYQHLWKNAGNCTLDINPDVLCDFTNLPFPDNSQPVFRYRHRKLFQIVLIHIFPSRIFSVLVF